MIIEYKLNRYKDGTLSTPPWVEKGGFYYNPSDLTFIGFVPSELNRTYYIPDTVTTLTSRQLKDRVILMGLLHPEDPFTLQSDPMTDDEIESHVDEILSIHDFE
jgi:hypothetical protein